MDISTSVGPHVYCTTYATWGLLYEGWSESIELRVVES